jgi:hypothetical protein
MILRALLVWTAAAFPSLRSSCSLPGFRSDGSAPQPLARRGRSAHYLFGHPWSKLLADYDVRLGRVWVFVLLATALAPRWAAGARHLPG